VSNTTTQAAVVELIRETIRGITPTGDLADAPWRDAADNAAPTDLRAFCLLDTPANFQSDPGKALWGCGERYTFELRVRTGYGHLDDRSVARVLARDGLDLRRALEYLVGSPSAGGLVCIEYQGFESDTDTAGRARTGDHLFTVDYMEDT